MFSLIKICGASLLSVVLSAVLRQRSSSVAPFLTQISAVLILSGTLLSLSPLITFFRSLGGEGVAGNALITALMNSVGSAVICRTVCDICSENGEKTLSDALEFSGNAFILISSLPLLSSVVENIYRMMGA